MISAICNKSKETTVFLRGQDSLTEVMMAIQTDVFDQVFENMRRRTLLESWAHCRFVSVPTQVRERSPGCNKEGR
jgi:hypothetical protein